MKRLSASKLTGSSKPHETRCYKGSKRDRHEEYQEVIDNFQLNSSKNYETYKAPDSFVNTFRKTRVSAYDKKKEVWIRTVDTRGREINYFYPIVGRTYFIATDFFNYDYFNTGKDKYKAHKGRNCSSCLREEYDKLKKGYWTLLSKNELYFFDTRFQYLLWTKGSRPTKKNKI
tara:strand:- start:2249 stop:2767 length:519 start_codon:yes stop_codon:yes gene_type:complete